MKPLTKAMLDRVYADLKKYKVPFGQFTYDPDAVEDARGMIFCLSDDETLNKRVAKMTDQEVMNLAAWLITQ